MKRFTLANTVEIGRRATVLVNGRILPQCVQAFVFGPFVVAQVIRTFQDGSPIVFDEGLRTRWVFGLGRVNVEAMA